MMSPDNLVLQPRNVQFDWSRLPMHWLAGEPVATHVVNALHLLLPEGERWFVRVFKQALPLIKDDKLREEVLGFIGQESMHAEAHAGVLEQFAAKGLDAQPYIERIEWLFRDMLGDRPELTGRAAENYLVERVATIATIEHMTAFLGHWILNAKAWDRAADPTMLDMLRWHGAEEVEHRSVAYDLLVHLDPRYSRRIRSAAFVFPMFLLLFVRGSRFLLDADPELRGVARHGHLRGLRRGLRRGLLPSPAYAIKATLRYFRPGYHPSKEGDTEQAVAYLASSPAARDAA